MSNSKFAKIIDVCSRVVSGGTPLRSNPEYYLGGKIPWLKTGDIKKNFVYEVNEYITDKGLENSSAKLIPQNSVLVAMYGDGNTAGNVAVNKVDLATNQACCNLIIDKNIADYLYVYYYLKGNYKNLVGLKLGGSQQNLNAKTIKNFPLWVPELKTQKKIAAILSAYDDLIENNKRRIALLENMAEEIYREWFVRFRFPGYKTAEFEKGIPKGWSEGCLGDVVNMLMGQSPKSEFYNSTGDGLPFHQGVGSYGKRFPKNEVHCSVDGRTARKGDILFSVRAPVGRLNIANSKIIIGRGLAALSHKQGHNSFLFYLLKVVFSNEDIIGNGSIFNSVGKDELKGYKLLLPPSSLVEQYESQASTIDKQISCLLQSIDGLQNTKNILLPRLISGKLSVEDLNIEFPPSMKDTEVTS